MTELNAENESDDYLIELIGLKKDFPDEAMIAYAEIYKRYWDKMYIIAKRVTKDADEAKDLLADTFNLLYNRASSFKRGKIVDKDKMSIVILGWMTKIMKHVFYDHYLDDVYKTNKDNDVLEESYIIENVKVAKHFEYEYDELIESLDSVDQAERINGHSHSLNGQESENMKKIQDYLAKLSERDRDIILTTYNHYLPGKNTPTEVLNLLEKRWVTSRENIRKILSKFRNSVKEELQAKLFIRK